jgi:hypothetical protein
MGKTQNLHSKFFFQQRVFETGFLVKEVKKSFKEVIFARNSTYLLLKTNAFKGRSE